MTRLYTSPTCDVQTYNAKYLQPEPIISECLTRLPLSPLRTLRVQLASPEPGSWSPAARLWETSASLSEESECTIHLYACQMLKRLEQTVTLLWLAILISKRWRMKNKGGKKKYKEEKWCRQIWRNNGRGAKGLMTGYPFSTSSVWRSGWRYQSRFLHFSLKDEKWPEVQTVSRYLRRIRKKKKTALKVRKKKKLANSQSYTWTAFPITFLVYSAVPLSGSLTDGV